MKLFYHYTSERVAKMIKSGSDIVPLSNVCIPDLPNLEWFVHIPYWARNKKYIYSLLNPVPNGWEETGQLERLFGYISSDRIALLRFNLPEHDLRSTYVLEGDFANSIDRFNREIRKGRLPTEDLYEKFRDYLDSKVQLSAYGYNYRLPEAIIPKKISNKRISIIEIFNS